MKKTLRVCAAALLLVSFAAAFTGCLKYTSNLLEVTGATSSAPPVFPESTVSYSYPADPYTADPSATVLTPESTTAVPVPGTSATAPTSAAPTSAAPTTAAPTTAVPTTAAQKDPSQWSKAEVVQFFSKAVNDAKAFKGNLSVTHSEEFSSLDITKCPGGQLGINLANRIASGVIKPTNETLQFANGTAQNAEGDPVPILLPKRQGFTLTADGVQNAKAMKNGALTMIEITLVSESSTLETPPKYNSAAIGYLDPSEVDLSVVKIERFNVTYSGSTIVATVDAEGRVVSASYTVPVAIDVRGSALGISGEFACNATEKEAWQLNW